MTNLYTFLFLRINNMLHRHVQMLCKYEGAPAHVYGRKNKHSTVHMSNLECTDMYGIYLKPYLWLHQWAYICNTCIKLTYDLGFGKQPMYIQEMAEQDTSYQEPWLNIQPMYIQEMAGQDAKLPQTLTEHTATHQSQCTMLTCKCVSTKFINSVYLTLMRSFYFITLIHRKKIQKANIIA
jgi:hypothetical protein